MAFQTGFAANECELHEIIHAFLIDTGWTLRAEIGPFDRVYYSQGEDGYNDIYIRCRAQLAQPWRSSENVGGRQFDIKDGYSGYVNFFAYQYFPETNDGYDGYGEAGLFGPRFYWFRGDSGGGDDEVYYQHAFSQDSGNRKWKFIGSHVDDLPRDKTSPLANGRGAFDGTRYFYSLANTFFRFNQFDVHNDTCVHITESGPNSQNPPANLVWVYDKETRKAYMYYVVEGRSGRGHGTAMDTGAIAGDMARIDLETGVMHMGFNGPTEVWDLDGSNNYQMEGSHMTWDGGNYMYCVRNELNNRREVARYSFITNHWSRLPDLPADSDRHIPMIFVHKTLTNASYNRLYIPVSNSGWKLYYIDLDDNSGEAIGSWTSAGDLPVNFFSLSGLLCTNGMNRMYMAPGGGNDDLYYAKLTDGTLTWNLESNYFPETVLDEGDFWYVDGYASRVRTTMYGNTKYWLVGSKDHLIVVTRPVPYGRNTFMDSEGTSTELHNIEYKYDYCYVGGIDPYTSTSTNAKTTSDVFAGSSVVIPIQLFKGEFSVGQKMFICNATGKDPLVVSNDVEGSTKKFMAMEQFEITNVIPGVSITADSLNNNYPSGSRLAFDPQPVGITFNGMDKIQMLNHINTTNDAGSTDMSESIASLESASDEIVNASGADERRGSYSLWPVSIVNEGIEAAYSGSEVRGKLIGIFAVSSNNISNEDVVTIGQNTYAVFNFDTSKGYYFAVGPIVEPQVEE